MAAEHEVFTYHSKVARDKCLKDWVFNESKGEDGIEISNEWGSGYPGDPVTKKFLRDNLDEVIYVTLFFTNKQMYKGYLHSSKK